MSVMLCKYRGSTPSFLLKVYDFLSSRSQHETQFTLPPSRSMNPMAAYWATLPKPWMAAVHWVGSIFKWFMASRMQYVTPKPVASVRPSDPPAPTGFPGANAGGEGPGRLGYSAPHTP